MVKLLKASVVSFLLLCLFACASATGVSSNHSNAKVNTSPNVYQQDLRIGQLELGALNVLPGSWKVADRQLRKDGQWQALHGAIWRFQAIQDGRVLSDSWQSFQSDGVSPSGYVNALRVFDPVSRTWQAAWLSSRDGQLATYQGREEEGKVVFTSRSETKGRLTRHVFSQLSRNSFKWQVEWSKDQGATWLAVYQVDAVRLDR